MNSDNRQEKPAGQTLLDEGAICISDPVLGIYLKRSGRTRLGTFVFLLLLPLVLLAYFVLITFLEDRLWLRSLSSKNPEYLGMSFLGDSMIWPYFFLIPLLLYLLRTAICETVDLLSDEENLVKDGKDSRKHYDQILKTAESHLLYRGKWRLGYVSALALGLLLWVFNTAACYDPAKLPPIVQNLRLIQIYTTDSPVLIPEESSVRIEKFSGRDHVFKSLMKSVDLNQELKERLVVDAENHRLTWMKNMKWRDYQVMISLSPQPQWKKGVRTLYRQKLGHQVWLEKPVTVLKWDTDLENAKLSWISARVWVLVLGYTLLPIILLRVCNLLFVIRFFYKRLSELSSLKVNPLSVDPRRNLHEVSQVVLKINYTLVVFLILLLLSFAKEGLQAEWHNYLLIILSVPIIIALLLWPLIAIRDVVLSYKSREVERHGHILDRLYREIKGIVRQDNVSAEEIPRLANLRVNLAVQEKLYEKVKALRVWPIPKSTVMKFAASISIPIVIAALNNLITGLLGIIFVW